MYVWSVASRSTFPCSTSCMRPTTASTFDTDPTLWTVRPVAGVWFWSSAYPTPSEKMISPSTATATDSPGRSLSFRICSM